jgi:hypothetical protein
VWHLAEEEQSPTVTPGRSQGLPQDQWEGNYRDPSLISGSEANVHRDLTILINIFSNIS